jgi:hypothetical protein
MRELTVHSLEQDCYSYLYPQMQMISESNFHSDVISLDNSLTSQTGLYPFDGGLNNSLVPETRLLGASIVPPTVTPDPGNGPGQAYNVGTLNGTRTLSDFVGTSDTNDFYRFDLGASGSLSLSLNGLSADADLQVLNSAGIIVGGSYAGSSTAESINLSGLAAGTYYALVYQYSGNTNYNLNLTADYAGNTTSSARNIDPLTGTQTFSDFVGSTDTNDYYQLNLSSPGSLSLVVNGLSANADLQVFNSAGTLVGGSNSGGTTAESLNLSGLAAGTYYARIDQFSGDTNYNLSVTADYAGNTQAAARNLGTLNGTQIVRDFVGSSDTNDYYQFNLSAQGSLNLALNGLSADADVQIFNSSGTVIGGSYYGGSTAESLNLSDLAAGTYYARVYQYSGDTNYNLSLTGDYAGNTTSAARNLGTLNGTETLRDFVGSNDPNDYYTFNLTGTTNFNLSLTGLNADADVQLLNSAGTIIDSSTWGSNHDESINRTLDAGNYYIQVLQYRGDTNYSLNLSTTSQYQASNLIPGENEIGNLSGTRNFSGSVGSTNTADVYHFNLGTASDFSLSLTGLSADGDVRLIRDANGNGIVDAADEMTRSAVGGTANESINLSSLAAGDYFAQVYQYSGNTSYNLSLSALPAGTTSTSPLFTSFSLSDASGDGTANTVFQGGAIRLNYNLQNSASLSNVRLEALSNGSVVSTLGSWSAANLSYALVNLASVSALTAGDYQFRVVARTTSGQEFFSNTNSLSILTNSRFNGTFAADTLDYSLGAGTGAIFLGRGGTDTFNLGAAGIDRSQIASINGLSLSQFNPSTNSTSSQAIYGGTAFDYLTLSDGREIYFQGVEYLRFVDGSTFELQVHPNDTHFNEQWNLAVSDVPDAWRFTQGSSTVLLASLDTGLSPATGTGAGIYDISTSRVVNLGNPTTSGHGHDAISVMASTANNNSGVTGINWNSDVYVNNVYGGGISLQQAIRDTLTYARAHNQRVVFQGGIQGEYWLNSGGTQAQLEQLIRDNSDIALFAVAAGNGNVNVDDATSNPVYSAGVARLQNTHNNVMAVGALEHPGRTTVYGQDNATSVDKAGYSNYGYNLTLMAATDSPATNNRNGLDIFNGTSAANPNMAGIASLVWSVNSGLNGGQVRQILLDTAMDLGTQGRDERFGGGLVNADAAVRRAVALQRNADVANLYSGGSLFT